MGLEFMYITNEPKIARIIDQVGIERVWIDLETLGKEKRQVNCDSVKSHHVLEDIPRVKEVLQSAKVQVRINPINASSKVEIDKAIHYGAEIIMLPYYKTVMEVKEFLNYVNGRATTVLLLETKEADKCLETVLKIKGIDEIHIGLNDLHLSYQKKFMFELLADGTVDRICNCIKAYQIPFGFGGIARLGKGILPAENIISEHYRIGSTRAILSRSFYNGHESQDQEKIYSCFLNGITEIRQYEKTLLKQNKKYFKDNCRFVKECVSLITGNKYE